MKGHPGTSHRHAVYRITRDVTGEAYKILLVQEAALNAVCLATVSHEADAWILSTSLASAVGQKVTLVRETMAEREAAYFKPI